MSTSTLEPLVTQSEVYPARTPIILMEHTRAAPQWVYSYIDEVELWALLEPDDVDLW